MGNGVQKASTMKSIYVDVEGTRHKAVFSNHCSSRDIKDLLASIAGVSRWSNLILKRKRDGAIIDMGPNMPSNTVETPYLVCVAPTNQQNGDEEMFASVLGQVADRFTASSAVSQLVSDVKKQLACFDKKLESVESLKTIQLQHMCQDIVEMRERIRQDGITWQAIKDGMKTRGKAVKGFRTIPNYSKYTLSEVTMTQLKKPTFNSWHWELNEMLTLIEHMYLELGLVEEFNINPVILRGFLMSVQQKYTNNPFHNFRHCFCVTQMMYSMIHVCNLWTKITKKDMLVMMTASVCHDLDHPGFNNTYQVNANTELATLYNDISPLENHHAAVTFEILSEPECNIFSSVCQDTFKEIRQEIITLILATDMSRHINIIENFKTELESFDFHNDQHMSTLKMIFLKCCDMSNEVRPMEVSEPWLECLLEEYFMQSDREKAEGLPVTPHMDRDKVTKAKTQIGFIKFVLIPMFELLTKLFPQVHEVLIKPLIQALNHYENLREEEENVQEDPGPLNSSNMSTMSFREMKQMSQNGVTMQEASKRLSQGIREMFCTKPEDEVE